jgi:5'-phosphate synthase pdxT subunit
MRELSIGILAVQGDIEENVAATNAALKDNGVQGRAVPVKYANQIGSIDGLILPGGESTVIGTLAKLSGATQVIKDRINDGMPVLGTCAGMIMLAKRAYDKVVGETRQQLLNVLDIVVERNAFGRQNDSFESDLKIDLIGGNFKGVFIRAPVVTETGKGVDVIASLNNKVVAVKQNNIIGTAFHPELSGDTRLHKHLVQMAAAYRS